MHTAKQSLRLSGVWFTRFMALGIIAIVLVGLTSFVPSAQADGGFSNQTLRGAWGFSSSATVLPPAAASATPAVVVGLMTFNGNGGCSIIETFNAGGFSSSQASTSCSYTVNPDGTGTLLAQSPSGPTPLSFVIVDGNQELRFIRTDVAVASGVARRQ
jgi:hypothetical protein